MSAASGSITTDLKAKKDKKKKKKLKKVAHTGVVSASIDPKVGKESSEIYTLLKKWMEEARNVCFMGCSNIDADIAATGNYNRYLNEVRDSIFKEMGVYTEIGFRKLLHASASLIETGTGNCGVMAGYVYMQALKHSAENRKKMATLGFCRANAVESHQCFVYGFQRNKDGSYKKPPFNDETLFVDPWYNTILTYKEINASQELLDRYFLDVESFDVHPDLADPVVANTKEEPKLLDEITRQFSLLVDKHLSKDVIPTKNSVTSSFMGYLVDTKKAISFLADKLLLEIQRKSHDEAKIKKIVRLLKHLDPSNKLLQNNSPAYIYLFLARAPKIYAQPDLCVKLLIRAFEAADIMDSNNCSYIQTNVLTLLRAQTTKAPSLLKDIPAKILKALEIKSEDKAGIKKEAEEAMNNKQKDSSAPKVTHASAASSTAAASAASAASAVPVAGTTPQFMSTVAKASSLTGSNVTTTVLKPSV